MKVFCKSCGCHFPQDFEETQSLNCNFWTDRNFPEDFATEHEEWARKIWDHQFSLDVDALALETDLVYIEGEFKCSKQKFVENQWAKSIPGYADWEDDKERRDLQKAWFKFASGTKHEVDSLLFRLFCAMWVEKMNFLREPIERDEVSDYLLKTFVGAVISVGGDKWKKSIEDAGIVRRINPEEDDLSS